MGFFSGLYRLFATMFGLAEGATQRGTDKMLTASAESIKSQFRKTRDDAIRDFDAMKEAVGQLITIREDKAQLLQNFSKASKDYAAKMAGAIDLYKKHQDEKYKLAYGKFAEEHEKAEARIDELEAEIHEQDKLIDGYKLKLQELKDNIDNLKNEEAETVADIVSSRKITELNAKLQGLSSDTQSQNIQAIREARKQLKAGAKLSNELLGSGDKLELETKLLSAGVASKHSDVFDQLVKLDNVFSSPEPEAKHETRDVHSLLDIIDVTPTKKDKKEEPKPKAVDPVDSLF